MGRKLYAKGEGFNPTTGIDDVEGLREELDALKGGSGGGGGDTTAIERRLSTAEGEIDDLQRDVAEQSEEVAAVGAKVDTLQGSDTGKSARTIAAEETAKIVGGAPDNYDTLKEIADYISSDAEGAAELRNKVNKNATDIADLQELTEAIVKVNAQQDTALGTKASTTEAQGYAATAKNEAIAAAAADAQEKANTAENNANDYTDGAVEDLAKGQVATNTDAIASLQTAQTSLSATVKTNTNNIATHTQQIVNLDSNKLGKTEKAADSAKSDNASALIPKSTTVTSVTNTSLTYHLVLADDTGSLPRGDNANALITIPTLNGNLKYLHQLGFTSKGLFHRKFYGKDVDTTTPWSQIAFTTDNVASATKLATPRTLWGQSFDGTGDIDGDMTVNRITNSSGFRVLRPNVTLSTEGGNPIAAAFLVWKTNPYGLIIRCNGSTGAVSLQARREGNETEKYPILLNPEGGNVGIGKTNPTEKLDVEGNIKASGMLTTGSDAHVGGKVVADGGITSTGDIDASGNNILGNLSGTIDRVANTGDNATPIHILGLPTEDNNKPLIDTGVTVEEGVISAEGFETSGTVDATTLKGNLDGTIKAVMRNTNLFLLGFAQEAGAAAKPYVTTQVSVNNGVLTIKGLRVEGDVEITGNTVIGGRLTSAASYQSSPISTTSEEGVPTTEEQLRAQISTLEERIEALERLIAQNNG